MDFNIPAFLLLMAAALCVITALAHSVLGEQRLIQPILASDMPLMQSPLARAVTRFAWHWTALLWFCVAAVLALSASGAIEVPSPLLALAPVHLVAGIGDAILSRGQHIGWPLITIIGVLTLSAHYITQNP